MKANIDNTLLNSKFRSGGVREEPVNPTRSEFRKLVKNVVQD